MTDHFSADVVSAQFPCGAAWLANALLELQIAVPELWGFDTGREWHRLGDHHARYAADDLPWRQTLAGLRPGREFRWQSGHRIRFTHALPWQLQPSTRRVLMVRDPRDALYSEWRRLQRNHGLDGGVDFGDFAAAAFWGTQVGNADSLWLHCASWLSVAAQGPEQLLVVRFEDIKTDPIDSLQRVVEFLQIGASPQSIVDATEASDVRHLQRIERALGDGSGSRVLNRAGIANEWRSVWQPHWHDAIGAHWNPVLSALRYPSTLASTRDPPLLQELLAASFDTSNPQRGRWHARLQRWLAGDAPGERHGEHGTVA